VISVVGWILPFGFGGMFWFKGPQKTINEEDMAGARVISDDVGKQG